MPANITCPCFREALTDAGHCQKSPPLSARFNTRVVACVLAALCLSGLVALGAPGSVKRADTLLSQMSLDEKIGQMVQVDLGAISKAKTDIQKYFIGSALSG